MVKKLFSRIRYRKLFLFIITLLVMGFIFGIFYYWHLNDGVKDSLVEGLVALKDGLVTTKINNFFIHLLIGIVILILSFTVIGLPLVYFYLFFEALSISFSISSIVGILGFRSLLFALLYFLIYKLLYLILVIFLIVRASRISKNMLGYILYRHNNELRNNIIINLRKVIVVMLGISILDVLLFSLSPIINKLLITLL